MTSAEEAAGQEGDTPVPPPKSFARFYYQTALSQYQNEVNLINHRNTAFVTVQSILVAALALMLQVNYAVFPYALVVFVWALAIAGSAFCYFHYRAGRSGALAAGLWRAQMRHLEANMPGSTPLATLYGHLNHSHQEPTKFHSDCDRCVADRMPLPNVWIITPAIFAVGWLLAPSYILTRLFLLNIGDGLAVDVFNFVGLGGYIGVIMFTMGVIWGIFWLVARPLIDGYFQWKATRVPMRPGGGS